MVLTKRGGPNRPRALRPDDDRQPSRPASSTTSRAGSTAIQRAWTARSIPGWPSTRSDRTRAATPALDLTTRDEMVEATEHGVGRRRDVPDRDIRDRHRRGVGRHRQRHRPFGRLRRVRPSRPRRRPVADHRNALALGGGPWSARLTVRERTARRPRIVRNGSRHGPATRIRRASWSATACASSTRSTARRADGPALPTWSIIHSRHWKMQIPVPRAVAVRVVTFDGRGNGRSDRPVDPEAYREERIRRRRAGGDGRDRHGDGPWWCRSRRGAERSLLLAAEHPERVEKMAFIAPALPLPPATPRLKAIQAFLEPRDEYDGWAK